MTVGPGARDGEIEAFVVDRYLETLLARGPRGGSEVATETRSTADRLVRDLPRFHPSFRFVDDLAARLASAADGPRDGTASLIDFPASPPRDDRPAPVRPVVIGGMLTSAALSLAGAAYMAWRRSHPPAGPMSRAVRAVARARTV